MVDIIIGTTHNIANELVKIFPPHKASLTLEHNVHKNYHQTVKQWEEHLLDGMGLKPKEVWVSMAERYEALSTNDCWSLQWYPETPIGSHYLLAHNLSELLKHAQDYKG